MALPRVGRFKVHWHVRVPAAGSMLVCNRAAWVHGDSAISPRSDVEEDPGPLRPIERRIFAVHHQLLGLPAHRSRMSLDSDNKIEGSEELSKQ